MSDITYLLYFLCHLQMFLVSGLLNHVSLSVGQAYIVFWISHSHMICGEVTIHCNDTCILLPSGIRVISPSRL